MKGASSVRSLSPQPVELFAGQVELSKNLEEERRPNLTAAMRRKLTTPKNHQSRRIDLSQQLRRELRLRRLRKSVECLKNGHPRAAWVFPSGVGTPLDESNVRKAWKRVLEKADLRHRRIHDLRHTFASLLIQQGESLVYIKEQMGHASIQITVDVYSHLVPGDNRAAVTASMMVGHPLHNRCTRAPTTPCLK